MSTASLRNESLLFLTRSEVESLLDLDTCIGAVEEAFRAVGEGRCTAPRSFGVHVEGGVFHAKGGMLPGRRRYFAAKLNGNFPANPARNGLPTVQGVVVLADADNGLPLAIMDSPAITTLRTGAATAVAARHLARRESRVVTIVGCGVQGRVQLDALRRVLPIERALAFDRDPGRSEQFAREYPVSSGFEVAAVHDLEPALQISDVVVTCTPSHAPILRTGSVRPGTFIAAVGADNPDKHEIESRLMANSTVVVDDLEQCASMGDLHRAIDAGVMAMGDVHATLGEVVAGRKPGRRRDEEVIVFDSTGIAIQDVAAASIVYERALDAHSGTAIALSD